MSDIEDIDWNFVTNNIVLSIIALFCILTAFSIAITIYYCIGVNRELNELTNKLLAKEKVNLNERRKLKIKTHKPTDIIAYVDTSALRPPSEETENTSNQNTVPINGSKHIGDNTGIVAKSDTTLGSVDTKSDPTIVSIQ